MGTGEVIDIVIVDDHPIFRDGLRKIFSGTVDMRVVGEAGTGEEAIELVNSVHPDIVLMDVQMPGLDGFGATLRLVSAPRPTRVLMLTAYDEDEYIYKAKLAGASGLKLKTLDPAELPKDIRAISRHGSQRFPERSSHVMAKFEKEKKDAKDLLDRVSKLNSHEVEILELVGQGAGQAVIAVSLFKSQDTVKYHMRNVFRKLEVNERMKAADMLREAARIQLREQIDP